MTGHFPLMHLKASILPASPSAGNPPCRQISPDRWGWEPSVLPPRKDTSDSSAGREKVTSSIGSHLVGGSSGPFLRLPPLRSPPPGSSLLRSTGEMGRGSRLTGSSILGYMLGTSAAFKLFPDWEGAGGVGDCLEEKRNHTEHQRANGGGSLETIKMWAMYKSSRELIKMQGFQKLGKLATACSHL